MVYYNETCSLKTESDLELALR